MKSLDRFDWTAIERALAQDGYAILPRLLSAAQCRAAAALYDRDGLFRSVVTMARRGFGRGEYKYFDYPLPPLVEELRAGLYARLQPIANRWSETLKAQTRFPPTHRAYLERCRAAGQIRPTPLLLRYAEGDYNRLHRDVYGEHVFPIQVAILLSRPGVDFEGGEFVLAKQRPRMQSRVMVVALEQGDGVAFAVNHRPAKGARGPYRLAMRHGVSALRSGRRHTLGVIFHDAR